MAKFSDKIGFVVSTETTAGVWKDQATEVDYYGDVIRDTRDWEKSGNVNDDIVIRNRISIVANPFAFANLSAMRYVKWMGTPWKILNVEVQSPRLILSIGGKYNGITA